MASINTNWLDPLRLLVLASVHFTLTDSDCVADDNTIRHSTNVLYCFVTERPTVFEHVDNRNILDFIKETHFYDQL